MAEAPNSPVAGAIPSQPAENALPQGGDATLALPKPGTDGSVAAADGRAPIVVDLRDVDTTGATFELVEARLVLRFADGQERPLAELPSDEAALLRLPDGEAISISDLAAALDEAGGSLAVPMAIAELAEAAPEAGTDKTGGGADFRQMQIDDLGAAPDPTMQLGAVDSTRPLGGTPDFFTASGSLDGSGQVGGHGSGGSPGAGGLGSGPNGGRFINNPPIARHDEATTSEKSAVLIDVLANDSDNDPKDAPRVVRVDDAGLVGRVTLNDDGTVLYETNGRFDHLGKGESVQETFTYTVADRFGATSTATVTVEVTGVNDAPEAAGDRAVTNQNWPVKIDVLGNDSDIDANDTLRVVSVDTSGIKGDAFVNQDGTLTYRPNGDFDYLGKGEKAFETFSYTVADQHGAIGTASVRVQINGVNDAPVAHDDRAQTNENWPVRIDVLANDTDVDINDTIRVVGVDTTGIKGDAFVNHDGTLTYRHNGAFDHLGQDEVAYETFSYTIADQHGATSTASVTVKIIGCNDAPVAVLDHVTTDEDTVAVFNLLANDTDVDASDVLRVIEVDADSLAGDLTVHPDGTVTYDPRGSFDQLRAGETAHESFNYTISDTHGATSTATVELTIQGVNDAPVAAPDFFIGYETVGFMAPIASLVANDSDVEGDPLSIVGIGNAVNGAVGVTPDGYVVFTPTPGYTGPAGFQYLLADGEDGYALGDVHVDVLPITPGVLTYETLSLFDAVGAANASLAEDGTTQLDLYLEVGSVAGTNVEIGGMPYFTAVMTGILQGVLSVTIGPDGTPQATGNLTADLNLELTQSPIFQPLGGDLYDALYLASGSSGPVSLPGNDPLAPPDIADLLGGSSLAELLEDALNLLDLGGAVVEIGGLGLGQATSIAFGDGTFYLDISGLISGTIAVAGVNDNQPLALAELFGQFAGAAQIDIREGLAVASDGFVDGDFQVQVASTGLDGGLSIGSMVSEEPALAA